MADLPEPLLRFDAVPAGLAAVDALRDRFQTERTAGRILQNTFEAVRVELTYHSNALEGSTLTLRDTHLVIEGFEPNTGKTLREIYEARNHDRALRAVETWAAARAHEPISETDLFAVHAGVMADIDAAGAGRLRTGRVLITGTRYVPPGPHRFAELLPALFALANRPDGHPVVRAVELHYNAVAVHPFNDGNGRTGRLMMNLALLRTGYPLAVIPVERRGEYLAALEAANAGTAGPFADFVASCVENSLRHLLGDG